MESDLAIITLVAIIVIGTSAVEMFKYYSKTKQKHNSHCVDDLLAQNKALIERIQVLEQLVTDDGYDLKRKFNQL
ncbi:MULTISPECIES: hypothetical protein [Pseudomonadati]|uniref:Phage shock protein B n=1 Tax=Shewanella aestuarii TaxID=1028752 RepID=A0ABT0L2G4_9GAMM|nr:hypothetical protein [Shewanella aestuarii]MCL1117885.1 hypothetical protein [Shewanella aestuarii]GGN78758.1 hypothetical protein GCM10009193_22120 [Shewanella aestuarii]